MKINHKIAIYSTLAFITSCFIISTPVHAAEITPPEITVESAESSVAPCSDIIDYRYKYIGDKLYRRLYNYTRGEWAEDSWHLVG